MKAFTLSWPRDYFPPSNDEIVARAIAELEAALRKQNRETKP